MEKVKEWPIRERQRNVIVINFYWMKSKLFGFLILIFLLGSCVKKEKFSKEQWVKRNSIGYPLCREPMLNDLLQNNDFKLLNAKVILQ